jgi:CheY-like chemotaxis protein
LVLVQRQVCAVLDRAARGPVRAISICAGQGHDLIGVLADHPQRADVTARLVELDEQNVLFARRTAHAAGLDAVEVVAADASITDAYAGAVPADLILLCGVFGNISQADIANTIRHLPRLCAPAATVIWTRHRHPPDHTPYIRETFERAGFHELAFEDSPPFGVGANRLLASPQPFQEGLRLFEFIGYDVLEPDFHASTTRR